MPIPSRNFSETKSMHGYQCLIKTISGTFTEPYGPDVLAVRRIQAIPYNPDTDEPFVLHLLYMPNGSVLRMSTTDALCQNDTINNIAQEETDDLKQMFPINPDNDAKTNLYVESTHNAKTPSEPLNQTHIYRPANETDDAGQALLYTEHKYRDKPIHAIRVKSRTYDDVRILANIERYPSGLTVLTCDDTIEPYGTEVNACIEEQLKKQDEELMDYGHNDLVRKLTIIYMPNGVWTIKHNDDVECVLFDQFHDVLSKLHKRTETSCGNSAIPRILRDYVHITQYDGNTDGLFWLAVRPDANNTIRTTLACLERFARNNGIEI